MRCGRRLFSSVSRVSPTRETGGNPTLQSSCLPCPPLHVLLPARSRLLVTQTPSAGLALTLLHAAVTTPLEALHPPAKAARRCRCSRRRRPALRLLTLLLTRLQTTIGQSWGTVLGGHGRRVSFRTRTNDIQGPARQRVFSTTPACIEHNLRSPIAAPVIAGALFPCANAGTPSDDLSEILISICCCCSAHDEVPMRQ